MIRIGRVEAFSNTTSCKSARGRVTDVEMAPRRSEHFLLPWVWIVRQLSCEPAAPSRGTQQSCTQNNGASYLNRAMAKTLIHSAPPKICICNALQNACKHISSHSHQEMTVVFIIGNTEGFTSEAEISLHNFPIERRVTDCHIS